MPRKPLHLLALVLLSGALAACGSEQTTMYEPGVYKGKEDAAASEEAAERRSGALRSRAERGFADR
ncbi:hypothetical protein M0534_00455 [Methylonatrum kenyense]|uniref:hypothetical protein n=1 Tax=Methylonatrum kenyense TaxID=455253 RepID=UPI0020BE5F50|nr:hypothetical protein [Methylonatrum kenyense]MCK8514803.1 hypothetical protein [Methylonatrum kenyense]